MLSKLTLTAMSISLSIGCLLKHCKPYKLQNVEIYSDERDIRPMKYALRDVNT